MALKEFQFTINVPEELLPLLKELAQGQTPEDNVKISLAIGLFLAKIMSLGKASEMAGLSLNDFIFLLQSNNIPWKEYSNEDLQYDEQAINESGQEYQNDLRNFTATGSITDKVNPDGRNSIMQKLKFTVIIEKDEDGLYVASVPALPGCHTQAKDLNELDERIREAIKLCLEAQNYETSANTSFIGIHEVEVST